MRPSLPARSSFPLLAALASLWLSACGPGPSTTDGGPEADGGPEPTAATCTVALSGDGVSPTDDGATASTSTGRALTFDIDATPGATITVAEVEHLEATLSDLDDDGVGTLTVWPDYEATGDWDVELSAHCPAGGGELDGEASATLTLTVTQPRWANTPSWTQGDTGPLGREYFSLWVDPTNTDRAFVYGGFHYVPQQFTPANDLWRFNLVDETWTELPATDAPLLSGGGFAVTPGAASGYYYGGLGRDGDNFSLPFSLMAVTWDDDGATFTAQAPSGAPASGDYQPAFFYDALRDRYLAIGGQGATGTHLDVTAFDPSANSWSSVAVDTLQIPSGRTGFFWTYDAATDRFVVFSGEQGGGAGGGCNCAEDTWALELGEQPPRWVRLNNGRNAPVGRRNGAYALDPVGHRLLVWGGTPDGATTAEGLWALRLDRGEERWDEVLIDEREGAPIRRSSAGMLYDAPRDRMLMGLGNDSIQGAHVDLWGLEF